MTVFADCAMFCLVGLHTYCFLYPEHSAIFLSLVLPFIHFQNLTDMQPLSGSPFPSWPGAPSLQTLAHGVSSARLIVYSFINLFTSLSPLDRKPHVGSSFFFHCLLFYLQNMAKALPLGSQQKYVTKWWMDKCMKESLKNKAAKWEYPFFLFFIMLL